MVEQHNQSPQAHPPISEKWTEHDRQMGELSNDIEKVSAELKHTKEIGELIQKQNDKNHVEVMGAVRAIHQRLDRVKASEG